MKITKEGFAVLEYDTHLSRWVEDQGKLCQDEAVNLFFLPHINPGDVVVDGGAAIGDHTIAYLDRVGPTGTVFAFEPNQDIFECLVYNCPGAICIKAALWNSVERLELVTDANSGAGFVQKRDYGMVTGLPLDIFHFPKLNFIKLDIEGSELIALNGASQTIKRHHPKIILEVSQSMLARNGSCQEHLIGFLHANGYETSLLQPAGINTGSHYDILALPR